MSGRSARILLLMIALVAVGFSGFGEGEWEYPQRAEEQYIGIASVDDTVKIDEPETEPLVDTFPVVHVDDAVQPRPRNPKRILDSVDVSALAEKLEADRLLLSEIRKDVPEAREEAELYLARLKGLAEKSDPVRLAPLFDRVLDQAPIYFRWLETEYQNQDEQITEYYVGGARGFAFAMENFKSAVFLVIMNRLDIASRVISVLEE
ncbi:MAG: hypothetical protein JW852_04580 [Spirochaetales bacterium]|nr:hypothetical protein [Spirochaetales bacterium]